VVQEAPVRDSWDPSYQEVDVFIDEQECTGCGVCIPYCPVEAISDRGGVSFIDFDQCVECGVCRRFVDCPGNAIHESPETSEWPRSVRRVFSDPIVVHPSTGQRGRGTEEMKTNWGSPSQ
jgi:ferredoxin